MTLQQAINNIIISWIGIQTNILRTKICYPSLGKLVSPAEGFGLRRGKQFFRHKNWIILPEDRWPTENDNTILCKSYYSNFPGFVQGRNKVQVYYRVDWGEKLGKNRCTI